MPRNRPCTVAVPALFISLLVGNPSSRAQNSEQPSAPPPWRERSVPLATETSINVANARGTIVDALVGLPEGIALGSPEALQQGVSISTHPRSMEELPTSSDVVVVATFTSHQTYESPSHRSLYTMANFKVDTLITDKTGHIRTSEKLPILLLGGSAVLSSGVSVTYGIPRTEDSIIPGHRYLAFLHFRGSGNFFELEKTWDLTSGKAVPNSAEDNARTRTGTSTVAGSSEQSLIATLKSTR